MAVTTGVPTATARGIAVIPDQPGELLLVQVPVPPLGPGDVLVRTLRAGICGTDREIIDGKLGRAPDGENHLVLGHEVLGVVEEVGAGVGAFRPGDLVSATVRRPDGCPACSAGQPDFCVWRQYDERGIFNQHGFLVERWVDRAEHLVAIPAHLEPVGVLLEPLSVVEKAYRQAVEIQRRITGWQPRSAVVIGAGPIGLLLTMLLRERGLDVWTLARTPAPNDASRLVEATGATYVSTRAVDPAEFAATLPNIDIVVEASGASDAVRRSLDLVGSNGVLVLLSITGGDDVMPTAVGRMNREFVLGNKVMVGSVNSHHDDFVTGVARFDRFEQLWPGLTEQLITKRLTRLEDALEPDALRSSIKTVIEFPDPA